MSRRLTERSIDHIVLERGEVANSWRTGRWPSLRLLTPNWQTRLPGHDYAGENPDGFMPAAEVVATLTRYARLIGAPVRTATTARTVRAAPRGFEIHAGDDVAAGHTRPRGRPGPTTAADAATPQAHLTPPEKTNRTP
jgi:putative flavoprotein involved in K+ transport